MHKSYNSIERPCNDSYPSLVCQSESSLVIIIAHLSTIRRYLCTSIVESLISSSDEYAALRETLLMNSTNYSYIRLNLRKGLNSI